MFLSFIDCCSSSGSDRSLAILRNARGAQRGICLRHLSYALHMLRIVHNDVDSRIYVFSHPMYMYGLLCVGALS